MRSRVLAAVLGAGLLVFAGPAWSYASGSSHGGGGHTNGGGHTGTSGHAGGVRHGGFGGHVGGVSHTGTVSHVGGVSQGGFGGLVGGVSHTGTVGHLGGDNRRWGGHQGWQGHHYWGGYSGWGWPFGWVDFLGWGWPFAYYGYSGPWWYDNAWAYGPEGGGAVGYGLTTVDTDVTPENALVNAWAYGPEGGGMAGYSLTTVATGVTPENALVYLNEVLIGIADDFDGKSDYLYLRPGRYRIEFRLSGYVSQGGEIDTGSEAKIPIDLKLERDRSGNGVAPYQPPQGLPHGRVFGPDFGSDTGQRGTSPDPSLRPELRREHRPDSTPVGSQASPSVGTGLAALKLRISPPNASVYLDGVFLASGAELERMQRGVAVVPGAHQIEVLAPNRFPKSLQVEVDPGKEQSVTIALP